MIISYILRPQSTEPPELIFSGSIEALLPTGTILNVQMPLPEPEGGWTPELQAAAKPIFRTFQITQYFQRLSYGREIVTHAPEGILIELDEFGKPKQPLVQTVKTMAQ